MEMGSFAVNSFVSSPLMASIVTSKVSRIDSKSKNTFKTYIKV